MDPTSEFLSYFPGNHVYCAIDDKGKSHALTHLHEGYEASREQIIERLRIKNANGDGIFFCVNEIDRSLDPQKHRTSKMLKRIRAVWADDDNPRTSPRSDWALAPNVVVETSPGKFHYYWLTTTDDLGEWAKVMNGIATIYETDTNSKDLVRVLRLPGFNHLKREPFKVHFWGGSNKPYDWDDVSKAFPPLKIETKRKKGKVGATHVNVTFADFTEATQAIYSGSNYHGAIMWLLNHWVNSGIKNPSELMGLIVGILNTAQDQDERWSQRMDPQYLSNNIQDAITFVAENPVNADVDVPEIIKATKEFEIAYPPGAMGDLCREINDMAPHGNKEVAVMAAFALVAGIIGRRYNILGTGLNLYIVLLADSGIGKANLKNSINTALIRHCALEGGIQFKGASRFTGPKPLFEMLLDGLSRICVLEESALMSESTAGDQKGLTRVMLDIYSSSGSGEYAGGEHYSKAENSIPVVPSPALTIAHVSTPLSYVRVLRSKDAAMTGELARVWMIRSMRDKEYLNRNRRKKFSKEISMRIKQLAKEAAPNQRTDCTNVVNVDTTLVDVQMDSDAWTDRENAYRREDDQLKRTLCSRAFIKIMKLSAITTVFNGAVDIGRDEYKWATESINGELSAIDSAISTGSTDSMYSAVVGIVAPVISNLFHDKYSDRQRKIGKSLKGRGMFEFSKLHQVLRKNETIKRFGDDHERGGAGMDGTNKILMYMLRNAYLTVVSKQDLVKLGCRSDRVYRITNDLLEIMEAETNE